MYDPEVRKALLSLEELQDLRYRFLEKFYWTIYQFWTGISELELGRKFNCSRPFTNNTLHTLMHLYPYIFYTYDGKGHVYYNWNRIPRKVKEALKKNAEAGFVTLGLRRNNTHMVEAIPLGTNCGPDMSLLWDYTKAQPRIIENYRPSNAYAIYKGQDNTNRGTTSL